MSRAVVRPPREVRNHCGACTQIAIRGRQFLQLFGAERGTGWCLAAPRVEMSDAREALSALYASTNGASWRQRGRWLTAKNVCKWHGIECDSNGDVTSIDLGGNNATHVRLRSNLSKLRTLNIDESQLSGTLPASLSIELRTILLANNPKISGTLPADLFRRLPSLTELDLSRTRLSGSITNSLTGARSLQRLQLDHTSISGTLPTTIGLLTTLSRLAHEPAAERHAALRARPPHRAPSRHVDCRHLHLWQHAV